jgi:hypothetical protein
MAAIALAARLATLALAMIANAQTWMVELGRPTFVRIACPPHT